MLAELECGTYRKHVVFENVDKVIYVVLLREDCGMLVVVLLLYKKFSGYLENIQFKLNTYDPCVTNRINVGKQQTVIFHVEDVRPSHVNPKVYDKFKEWTNHNYGKHGEVKYNRLKLHEYLGMNFDLIET